MGFSPAKCCRDLDGLGPRAGFQLLQLHHLRGATGVRAACCSFVGLHFAQIQMFLCLCSSKGVEGILFSCLSISMKFPQISQVLRMALSTMSTCLERKYSAGFCEGEQFHFDKKGLRDTTSGFSFWCCPSVAFLSTFSLSGQFTAVFWSGQSVHYVPCLDCSRW